MTIRYSDASIQGMTLDQLHSLTEDEIAMLWHAINKIQPPVLAGVELEPSVFCSIKHSALINRVSLLEPSIKEEHKSIYESLKNKLSKT